MLVLVREVAEEAADLFGGAPFENGLLGAAVLGEPHELAASVGFVAFPGDEPACFEAPEQATGVPGVHPEAAAQLGDLVDAFLGQLVEHPGFAEGVVAGDETFVENPDETGVEPVEGADLRDAVERRRIHVTTSTNSLTWSSVTRAEYGRKRVSRWGNWKPRDAARSGVRQHHGVIWGIATSPSGVTTCSICGLGHFSAGWPDAPGRWRSAPGAR
ncbi:hypothetical protein GCM10027445_45480 [Amycolatopsis endophytica]